MASIESTKIIFYCTVTHKVLQILYYMCYKEKYIEEMVNS